MEITASGKKNIGTYLGLGLLVALLAALTLSPGNETTPTPSVFASCKARTVSAAVSANIWEWQNVCAAGEIAIASSGKCPNNSAMVGNRLTTPDTGDLDQRAYLYCSSSGTASFYATCCPANQ